MKCCSDVMTPIDASSCCTPQDTAAHAARAMRGSGCGCAPVVEDTACCGTDEPVDEARRKLHQHRATSLPVADKAGGCCGAVSAHALDRG